MILLFIFYILLKPPKGGTTNRKLAIFTDHFKDISDIAIYCQFGRKTVEGYISILEDLLLSFKISIFKKRAKRILSAHPKFYFFDAGVFRSIRPEAPVDSPLKLMVQHLKV